MPSLQLAHTFQGKASMLTSKRKALAVVAAVVVAGGGLAYTTFSLRKENLGHEHSFQSPKNLSTVEPGCSAALVQRRKKKRNGLKSVKALLGIFITQMDNKGRMNLVFLAITAVLRTSMSNRLAKVQGLLFRAAFLKHVPLFFHLMFENMLLCLIQATLFSTSKFLTGALSICFRRILTDNVHADYFQHMTYYKLSNLDRRISNQEQCIASDIPIFSSEISCIIQEMLNAICDGFLYTWSLCSYTNPKYALWMLYYVAGAGILLHSLAPPFGKLISKEQKLEGEYRQLHSRFRTHSESIAFYAGQVREASIIEQCFNALVKHVNDVQHTHWWFGMIQDFISKYLGATAAVVFVIQPFFSAKLKWDESKLGHADMLSKMRYHSSVVASLFQSLGVVAVNIIKLNRISGYSDRIHELMLVARQLRTQDKDCNSSFMEANYIEFEGVKVVTPTGNTLVENLSLKVEPGSNLLITGPNGSGKSSLFRVLGGLWPLTLGRISKPGKESNLNKEIFYVPQRPYMSIGTLQDQLIYPLSTVEETEPLTKEGLWELLRNVDLEYLLERYCLDQEVDWGHELSLGEQQRLGMARLLYHKPSFAILDECTSAVTTDMEERFCCKVRAMGTSCITISHRPALVAFHDIVLSLDGEGGWSILYKKDIVSQPHIISEEGQANLRLTSIHQNDALSVKKPFCVVKEGAPHQASKVLNSYIGMVLAKSPSPDSSLPAPLVPRLSHIPQKMQQRVVALAKALVPSLSIQQAGELLAMSLLVVARTWIADRIANLNGTSVKHVLEQDRTAFVQLIGVSVLQSVAYSIIAPSLRYLTARLALGWRKCITQHLSTLYFSKNAFYKVFHLSDACIDADQRITEDVKKFVNDVSGLIMAMVKPLVDILWFTWRMKMLTGRRGVAILYTYMLLGLGILRLITPDFGSLTNSEQQLEGFFRYMHSRLHSHAESIAFFGGGQCEQQMIESRFNCLLDHSWMLLKKRWLFGIADEFITKQLPHNVAWVLSLLYSIDHHGNRNITSVQGELAHDLRFLGSVVSQSFLAFGDILELYKKFIELAGAITRVSELDELLHQLQYETKALLPSLKDGSSGSKSIKDRKDCISFSEVDIVTPAHKILARKLTFCINPGESLLVTGPNGSGKSSLFRVLGGLWPVACGNIAKPVSPYNTQSTTGLNRDIFYVPQHPYCPLGTFRDQIIYPLTFEEAAAKINPKSLQESTDKGLLLDARLKAILSDIRLGYLLDREGGWNATANWENLLSLGEQQRLGMARLFFHNPKYGILDECTNATSVEVEEHLYELAKFMGITVVTISQRPALIPYHSMELNLVDGEGGWELKSIKQYQN